MSARPSRWSRTLEALSQLLCVIVVDGDADEMLSSYSYRTNSWMLPWINWLFRSPTHCRDSYEWEKEHYNVDRFRDAQ